MGKRLSKIYTRTGDKGETGLGDGSRISKTHPRVDAMGSADELNSIIGLLVEALKAEPHADLTEIATFLRSVQHRIFDVGGEISIPGYAIITDDHVTAVEEALDALNEHLAPLENFILPGGSPLIAQCHHARAVCRRAERALALLGETEDINQPGLTYLNRLSDYLFVVARSCARITGVDEVLWEKG